jgi:hypothetical protein
MSLSPKELSQLNSYLKGAYHSAVREQTPLTETGDPGAQRYLADLAHRVTDVHLRVLEGFTAAMVEQHGGVHVYGALRNMSEQLGPDPVNQDPVAWDFYSQYAREATLALQSPTELPPPNPSLDTGLFI